MFNIDELVDILGYPMMDKLSQEVLSKNGFTPGYKEKQLRAEGSVNLGVRDWGIELAFDDKDHYSESYAVPKAPGDAVFTAIFIEPAYTNGFSSFAFPKALDIRGCNVRDEALKRFGVPEVTRTDDGIVEWDRWIIREGLSIRAEYKDDQSIYMWTIGVPMKL